MGACPPTRMLPSGSRIAELWYVRSRADDDKPVHEFVAGSNSSAWCTGISEPGRTTSSLSPPLQRSTCPFGSSTLLETQRRLLRSPVRATDVLYVAPLFVNVTICEIVVPRYVSGL